MSVLFVQLQTKWIVPSDFIEVS